MRWALATVAPWALATGVLVSFTAAAGQPPEGPETLVGRLDPAEISDLNLGPGLLSARSAFQLPALALGEATLSGRYETAAYSYEEPARLVPMNELRPRGDLKPNVNAFPEVNRANKSDPLLGLRPTISRAPAPVTPASLNKLLFESDHGGLSSQFSADAAEAPAGPQNLAPFSLAATPAAPGEALASPATSSFATPGYARARERRVESVDGATPATPRALAIASVTPAPADMMPVEIAAVPVSPRLDGAASLSAKLSPRSERGLTIAPKGAAERPDYAALIDREQLDKETRCLAEAVYFESRSEPADGQAAVAQVVLNRVKSGLYPDNICGVVYQNRQRYLGCQFTFACEGRALRINDQESWATASRIAREVLEGRTYLADVGGATHYHATYVRPWWARRLKKMDAIGRHVFYQLKPGQT